MEENLSSANKAEATLADIPLKPKRIQKNLRANEVIRSPSPPKHTHAQKVQSLVKWNNLSTQNQYNKAAKTYWAGKKVIRSRSLSKHTQKIFFARQAIK